MGQKITDGDEKSALGALFILFYQKFKIDFSNIQ